MTLYRQLLLFTLVLCFVLFIGVWAYKVQSTRSFLEHQLEAHAQDTATSLGLSLTPLVAEDDLAGVETMMNAIFDRGYYREIVFSDVKGEVVVKRVLPVTVEGVPDWFIKAVPLVAPGGEALIMDGWKRAGSVLVISHPGYAYQTLWQTFVHILVYFLLTGLVVFILGGLGLRFLLRPLRRVEQQAEAICRNEFEIQQQIPRTRELQSVVRSMNAMTSRVHEMFEEQATIADKLRQSAFGDPLTGLGNRRFLQAQIEAVMQDEQKISRGSFLLIQVLNLQEINDEKGYSAGDQLLTRASQIIAETAASHDAPSLARLSGGDFVAFLPDLDREDSEQVAALLCERLAALAVEDLTGSAEICSIGGVYYNTRCSFEQFLGQADTALIAARHEGPNCWRLEPAICNEDDPAQGKIWWRKTLEQSLADRAINLYGQRVVQTSAPAVTLHRELFSRITIDRDKEVPASVFIPLAEHAEVITELDRKVVELILETYPAWQDGSLAVNLSVTSLLENSFTDWLYSRLKTIRDQSLELFFEFPESSVVGNLEAVREFSRQIKGLGHDIGIDHFGRSFANFGYLKSLQPDYVKIDAAFTRELDSQESDGYFFIGSLTGVAHSLDIKVIAEGVETETQLDVFKELKVDGFQGYLVEQPLLLTSKV